MNQRSVLTSGGEYYRLNLMHLEPFDRAKFMSFVSAQKKYEFTNADIFAIECGNLPHLIANWHNYDLMCQAYK